MSECLQYERVVNKVHDVAFVRPKQAKLIPRSSSRRIVQLTIREIDGIVLKVAQAESPEKFRELVKKYFEDYVNLSLILANTLATSDENRSFRQTIIRESFRWVEERLEQKGIERLGGEAIREAVFCAETLRRAYRLVDSILLRENPTQEHVDEDRKLALNFNFYASWAQLHLICIFVATIKQISVAPNVLALIVDGLRSSTDAYALARKGVALRAKQGLLLPTEPLTEEDRELLDESYEECHTTSPDDD